MLLTAGNSFSRGQSGKDWSGTPAKQRLIFLLVSGGWRRKTPHHLQKYSRCKAGRTESLVQPPKKNLWSRV